MESRPRKLKDYVGADGRDPFDIWITGLRDGKARGIIRVRLNRVSHGNFGDCHPVGGGVSELRIDFGPGYRVYFGIDGGDVILLGGGTKDTQSADIEKARECWDDYHA